MNANENKRIVGAMENVHSIESELSSDQTDDAQTTRDRELELIDDLLTLQMGIGPLRRKMATGENSNNSET
ncbi:MAG: hypothetical protein AB8B91_25290 [Rubripirellula sp.]